MLQMGTVPRRQDERQCVGLDLHLKEKRTLAPVDSRAHVRNFGASSDGSSGGKPARARDRRQIHSVCGMRSEEHTSELQSHVNLVCRLLLEKKNNNNQYVNTYPRPYLTLQHYIP